MGNDTLAISLIIFIHGDELTRDAYSRVFNRRYSVVKKDNKQIELRIVLKEVFFKIISTKNTSILRFSNQFPLIQLIKNHGHSGKVS